MCGPRPRAQRSLQVDVDLPVAAPLLLFCVMSASAGLPDAATARVPAPRAPCSVRRLQPTLADATALSVILRANDCEWAPLRGGSVEQLVASRDKFAAERVLQTLASHDAWIAEAPLRVPIGYLLRRRGGEITAAGLLLFWRGVGLEAQLLAAAGLESDSLDRFLPPPEQTSRDEYSIRPATATPDDAARLCCISEAAFLEVRARLAVQADAGSRSPTTTTLTRCASSSTSATRPMCTCAISASPSASVTQRCADRAGTLSGSSSFAACP